jgi:hypothetical protein
MVGITTSQVLRIRDCVLTNITYTLQSFRDLAIATCRSAVSVEDTNELLFHNTFVCMHIRMYGSR